MASPLHQVADEGSRPLADMILAGPRGRVLCLLAAIEVERAHRTSHGLEEPGPLCNADFFTAAAEEGAAFYRFETGWRGLFRKPENPAATTPAELRDAIATVDPGWGVRGADLRATPPGEEPGATANRSDDALDAALPELLAQTVDMARYWQSPHVNEQYVTSPEFDAVLRPWAERLAALPDARWWASSWDSAGQYLTWWRGPDDTPPIRDERPRLQQLDAAARNLRQDENVAARELSPDPTTNLSGEWWSTPMPALSTTRWWPSPGPDAPVAALLTEDRCWDDIDEVLWQKVNVPTNAHVLEITSAQIWLDLCRDFPLVVTATKRHDWYRCTGWAGTWVVPDWSQVARHWDGIHLPVASYLALAGRALALDEPGGFGGADAAATLIAGWSPDETHWFIDIQETSIE